MADIKEQIRTKVQQKIRERVAALTPTDKTLGGFFSNAKEDIVDFSKGILYLGREAITHPINSIKNVSSTGWELAKEMVKSTPSFLGELGKTYLHPKQRFEQLANNIKDLRNITYEEQKLLLDDLGKDLVTKQEEGTRGEKFLGALGSGLVLDGVKEITHPIEYAYEKPFTFTLDALMLSNGKVITTPAKVASKTKIGAKTIKAIEELFIPDAKLKNAGYGKFADDLNKTKELMFNSQQKIIESTAKTFEKDLKLTKPERIEFFETVDKLRRDTTGKIATSKNPKIQKAIDWWLGQEVPKLRANSGLSEESAITNYLHHYFPDKYNLSEARLTAPAQYAKRGFLKKSEDVAGFSKDPLVSISAIKSKVAFANLKDNFIARTIEKYSQDVDRLKTSLAGKIGLDEVNKLETAGKLDDALKAQFGLAEYKPSGSLRFYPTQEGGISVTKKVETHLLPEEIVKSLNDFTSKNTQSLLIKPLDFFNRNWKPLATAVRPRYHTRNILGNLYNGIYLGSTNIKNLGTAALQQIGGYFNEFKKGTGLASSIAKKILPDNINTKLFQQAIDDGVIGRGFFAMDLHDLAKISENADDIIKAINKYKNPAEIYRVPGLRQYLQMSFNVGQALEDNARLALYIDRINKGFSRTAAKADVNKYLFDYLTGLSDTDKAIKKIFPFWSWTRFNLPLQSEALVTKSLANAVINKVGDPVTSAVENKDDLSKYLSDKEKEAGYIKVGEVTKNGETYNKYIRTESVLPVNDLTTLIDIFRFDLQSLGVNPLIGLEERLRNNRNYFDNLIERFPGEEKTFLKGSFSGKTIEKLKVIPFLSELNKAISGSETEDNILPTGTRLELILSPLSTSLKNKEELETFGILEKEKILTGTYEAGLESLYKTYLIKSAKDPNVKSFQNNVEKLEKLLKQQGFTELNLLPIKLKATKEAIKEKVKEEIKVKINANKNTTQ